MKNSYVDKRHDHHLYVLDVLKKAIKEPFWEESKFLKANKEELIKLQDQFNQRLELEQGYLSNLGVTNAKKAVDLHTGQMKVYVSIYNTEGNNLEKWAKIILSLIGSVVTRSVYRVEDDVKNFIRSKPIPAKEGYLVVYLGNGAILEPPDNRPPLDRDGHELLLIKDGSIIRDNVLEFVHVSGIYNLKYNRLVPKTT